jgi:hypothetical protein
LRFRRALRSCPNAISCAAIVCSLISCQYCWAKEAGFVRLSGRAHDSVIQRSQSLTVSLAGDFDDFDDCDEPQSPAPYLPAQGAGAILRGAGLLTNFRHKGAYWIFRVQVDPGLAYPGECTSTHVACKRPEVLFFDEVAKKRVMSLSDVGPGSWYLDYTTGTVYLGDDPTGYTVELSLSGYASNSDPWKGQLANRQPLTKEKKVAA